MVSTGSGGEKAERSRHAVETWYVSRTATVTPLEFIRRARSQSEVVVDRVVSVPGAELTALLRSGRPLRVSELSAHPDQRREVRRFRYGSILGAGASDAAIAEWQTQHPEVTISWDVVDLLRRVDGIHLWADLHTGRAYFGVLPLMEWCQVNEHEGAELFREIPRSTVVVSYNDNGDYYLLLDAAQNRFTWFDPQSPDDSTPAGDSIEQFLDWWWEHAQELDPRNEKAG